MEKKKKKKKDVVLFCNLQVYKRATFWDLDGSKGRALIWL